MDILNSSRPLGIEINLLDGVPSRDSNHFFTPVITTLDSISFFSSWKLTNFHYSGLWFGIFLVFHNIWDNPSHWLSYVSWFFNHQPLIMGYYIYIYIQYIHALLLIYHYWFLPFFFLSKQAAGLKKPTFGVTSPLEPGDREIGVPTLLRQKSVLASGKLMGKPWENQWKMEI